MNEDRQSLVHLHSNEIINEEGKIPASGSVEYGEIAIGYAEGYEKIFIRNDSDEIVSFSPDYKIEESIASLSGAVIDSEEVVSQALNNLNDRFSGYTTNSDFSAHTSDTDIHVTAQDKTAWSSKQDSISDLSDIRNNALSGASAYTDVTAHTSDTDIHVTAQDKTTWGGKQDSIDDLSDIRNNALSGASAYTEISAHTANTSIHLPEVTSSDDGKILKVVGDEWSASTPNIVYAGTETPPPSLGNNGDVYLQTGPTIIYETDGTTGLLGHNQSSFADQWQLENLDLTPYRYIKCYIKASNSSDASNYTPAVVVTVPLDNAAMGPTAYMGGVMVALPFNRNREYMVTCAVDGSKTRFQVVHQNTLWDITTSDANNTGRYLYKIEGYI